MIIIITMMFWSIIFFIGACSINSSLFTLSSILCVLTNNTLYGIDLCVIKTIIKYDLMFLFYQSIQVFFGVFLPIAFYNLNITIKVNCIFFTIKIITVTLMALNEKNNNLDPYHDDLYLDNISENDIDNIRIDNIESYDSGLQCLRFNDSRYGYDNTSQNDSIHLNDIIVVPTDWVCSICLEEDYNDIVQLKNCSHILHKKCYNDLKKYINREQLLNKCPECNQVLIH